MASDPDTSPFSFAIYGEVTNDVFTIDMQSGVISTARPLDYEEVSEYSDLVLFVFDSDLLRSNASLRVVVLDENDNSPSFANDTIELSIVESTPLGSEIYEAMATDSDDTSNAQLMYSLVNDDTQTFMIDSLTGAITLEMELDFETQIRYSLLVLVVDSGDMPRNGSFTLNVEVLDHNDNSPIIINQLPSYSINENLSPGQFVGSVNATDNDSGDNALIQYEIMSGNEANRFSINTATGDIVTNAIIDREEQSVYELTVVVSAIGILHIQHAVHLMCEPQRRFWWAAKGTL